VKKIRIISAVIVSIALAIGVFMAIRLSQPGDSSVSVSFPQEKLSRVSALLGGEVFDVMVARTESEQSLGLGGFPGLDANEGMIFPYARDDSYGFWMKDMLFSIDIVWLDKDSKIVWIEQGVSPDTYPSIFFPRVPARSVLELQAGTVARIGVAVGSTLEIDLSMR
jgi:uncharacterized membrane protein (UPF0127 family)